MDNAYLAGLVDGEGSIMLLKKSSTEARRPTLAVSITERHILEAVADAYGGRVRKSGQHVPIWMRQGHPALEVLRLIRPFLVIERRQRLADLLLHDPIIARKDVYGRGGKIQHNERVFRKMQEENARHQATPAALEQVEPRKPDFAYFAGILDGEGYVSANLRRIEVVSTDPELCAWLKSRFGGNIYMREAEGNRKRRWDWKRSATGCTWAARVADLMYLGRKSQELRQLQDFKRQSGYCEVHPHDGAYKALREQGIVPTVAAREARLPKARARRLEPISEKR